MEPLEKMLIAHIEAEGGTLEQINAKLEALTRIATILEHQMPDLLAEVRRLGERQDQMDRDLALLRPLQDTIRDHENRIRMVETASMKLATQAAVIASLISSALPIAFKLFGGSP